MMITANAGLSGTRAGAGLLLTHQGALSPSYMCVIECVVVCVQFLASADDGAHAS